MSLSLSLSSSNRLLLLDSEVVGADEGSSLPSPLILHTVLLYTMVYISSWHRHGVVSWEKERERDEKK